MLGYLQLAILVALTCVMVSGFQSNTVAAQTPTNNPLLVSATVVGPGETMVAGFVSSFVDTPTGTHLTIVSANVGTKMVYYAGFPFKAEEMRGTTRNFLIDRAVNSQDEHLIKKMLVSVPVRNTPTMYNTDQQPFTPKIADDERQVCGTVEMLVQSTLVFLDGRTEITVVKFNDGRSLKILGIPEVTVTKGKIYTFVLKKNGIKQGYAPLVSTTAANICGYDKAR